MAEAIAAGIANKRHIAVQAGTGTGKTLAYLVPAVLARKKTIVATATKALQDQLALKDLPFLERHLERPFSWAILKGRSEEHTSELQSLMRISYAVFCLKKKTTTAQKNKK